MLRSIVNAGIVSGIASGAMALAASRLENRRAAPALNAVSHIAHGGTPPADAGPSGRNFILGSALHVGACVFWSAVFELACGRAARRSDAAAALGAAATATAAYMVDYHVVPQRLRPGMERFLSRRSLMAVYGALAVSLALAARVRAARSRPRRRSLPQRQGGRGPA